MDNMIKKKLQEIYRKFFDKGINLDKSDFSESDCTAVLKCGKNNASDAILYWLATKGNTLDVILKMSKEVLLLPEESLLLSEKTQKQQTPMRQGESLKDMLYRMREART